MGVMCKPPELGDMNPSGTSGYPNFHLLLNVRRVSN